MTVPQNWLRKVRKYGEIITTTNKKPDSTPPVTSPQQPPATVPTQPPVQPPATTATEPPLQPPAQPPVTTATTPPTPPNTAVLPPSGAVAAVVAAPVPAVVAAGVAAPSEAPDFFKNARALSDEQAISSLKFEYGEEIRQSLV